MERVDTVIFITQIKELTRWFNSDSISAVELSKLGHEVTLSDISASELELATGYAKEENVCLEQVIQVDARDLRSVFTTANEFDIVLLLGPLYHLLDESERVRAIEDCIAITKPKGYIICSFVTKFAHFRDLVQKDPGRLYREKEFYRAYSLTGKYTRNMATISHHTDPSEIRQLYARLERKGLAVRKTVGCEGFLGGSLSKHLTGLENEEYESWVDLIMETAEDPSALSASDHIIVVATKV